MQRINQVVNLLVHVPNEVQGAPNNSPVSLTVAQLMMKDGQMLRERTAVQLQPAIPDDITPELLAALNVGLASMGLKLERLDG